MSIEASLPLARSPAPSFLPPVRGAVTALVAEQPIPTRRASASPLLAHIARFADGSPLPAADVEAMLQLATHQESLLLERKRATAGEALRQSPWPAIADAEPGDEHAQQVMQEVRRALHELIPQHLLQDAEQRAGGSHSDFFKEIAALISRLDGDWISRYSEMLAGYVEFYRELTDALKDLGKKLPPPDKDGNIEFDPTDLHTAFDALKEKWSKQGFGPVYENQADAQAFLDELGIEGLKIIATDPGPGWQVSIDPDLITDLGSVFPDSAGKVSASALNEMMTQKEIMMERFNFINRALPEKYQRQLQNWDMLVKVLSSTIDAVTEGDRAVIQAMAG